MPAKVQTKTKATLKTPRKPVAARRPPAKTGYINARIEPKLKKDAEKILQKIGISTSEAVTVFLKQVVLQRGLPFPVRVPNAETLEALRELESGGGTRYHGDLKDFTRSLLHDD